MEPAHEAYSICSYNQGNGWTFPFGTDVYKWTRTGSALHLRRALKIPERLCNKTEGKNGEGAEEAGEDDDVAGEVCVSAHLLDHGEAGNGARRSENDQDRDEVVAAEAKEQGGEDDQKRDDDQAAEDGREQRLEMIPDVSEAEESAQQEEHEGRGNAGHHGDGALQDLREFDSEEQEEEAESASDDQGICHDRQKQFPDLQFLPVEEQIAAFAADLTESVFKREIVLAAFHM